MYTHKLSKKKKIKRLTNTPINNSSFSKFVSMETFIKLEPNIDTKEFQVDVLVGGRKNHVN